MAAGLLAFQLWNLLYPSTIRQCLQSVVILHQFHNHSASCKDNEGWERRARSGCSKLLGKNTEEDQEREATKVCKQWLWMPVKAPADYSGWQMALPQKRHWKPLSVDMVVPPQPGLAGDTRLMLHRTKSDWSAWMHQISLPSINYVR